jgi:hypothetical protein
MAFLILERAKTQSYLSLVNKMDGPFCNGFLAGIMRRGNIMMENPLVRPEF